MTLLSSAFKDCPRTQESLMVKLEQEVSPELSQLLHSTIVVPIPGQLQSTCKSLVSVEYCLTQTELLHLVIERLLLKQRKSQWLPTLPEYDPRNVLTLGYEEGRPDLDGYRIRDSNSIMCYYPNSLASALKEDIWEMYHRIVGDDCMVFLLSHHAIFVLKADIKPRTYMQIAGPKLGTLLHLERNIRSKSIGCKSAQKIVRINSVLYARDTDQAEKKTLFPSSHIFMKEICNCRKVNDNKITHAAATRIIRMIFSSETSGKNPATFRSSKVGQRLNNASRLPKRLNQMIPFIMETLDAIGNWNSVDRSSKQIATQKKSLTLKPPRLFVRYCTGARNRERLRIAQYGVKIISNPARWPQNIAQIEDEYWSQEEFDATSNTRKRRRYEEALDALDASIRITDEGKRIHPVKRQKVCLHDSSPDACRLGSCCGETSTSSSNSPQPLQHHSMITQLLRYATSKQHVYRWIRDCLARLLPSALLGTGDTGSHNWRIVRRFVRVLLKSAIKNDSFSAKKVSKN
uniref:Telomerase reverse transcriptase n=1 Tax=Albugo laibachii Nc14 TaxID=890382 RepID=F0X2Q0_9STRA|nr:conserved hypothetical protein [Albugo laibachii Nc14]|eukprot:CCA28181.1 conserved hypothetical protein [Albugo laibachii Nc14]